MVEQSIGEIYIEAPINRVYDYATQPARWNEWHPTSLHADTGNPGTPTSGQQFQEVVDILGDEVTLSHTVTRDERPEAFETQFTSSVGRGSVHYELRHQGTGTAFTRTLNFELNTPNVKLSGRMREISEKAMANLKRRVEQPPA